MSMIDYGAIVFKNGKRITEKMFTPMMEAVGWEDTPDMKTSRTKEPIHLNGMYFTYIGDKDITVAFYKDRLTQVHSYEDDEDISYTKETQRFGDTGFKWSKWTSIIGTEYCTVKPRNGYYVFKWKYKGDKYKVYFGPGVEVDAYKKWHIVNYYRSIPYYWNKLIYNLRRIKNV